MTTTRSLLGLLIAALFLLVPGSIMAKKPDAPGAPGIADFTPPTVGGGERIINYLSEIDVARDGALNVTETIRVMSELRDIRHGIYRDFPTRYERNGRRVRVGFDVVSVQRDGQAEPWTTERIDNGVRVRIGSADVDVAYGEHSYVIRYTTTRQLGFFPTYDELYWNVTGNGWMFAIGSAEARIRLPQPVQWGNRAVYTGPQGSTASDGMVVSERPGEIVFRTTRTARRL